MYVSRRRIFKNADIWVYQFRFQKKKKKKKKKKTIQKYHQTRPCIKISFDILNKEKQNIWQNYLPKAKISLFEANLIFSDRDSKGSSIRTVTVECLHLETQCLAFARYLSYLGQGQGCRSLFRFQGYRNEKDIKIQPTTNIW